jgi:hypothetical protein
VTLNPEPDTPYKHCKTCSSLSNEEYAFQKYGWEQNIAYMSEGAGQLIDVKDLKPGNTDRRLVLQQCPECKTYYLYRTDYEYLAGGTEDEQFLTRLTNEEATKYLEQSSL